MQSVGASYTSLLSEEKNKDIESCDDDDNDDDGSGGDSKFYVS